MTEQTTEARRTKRRHWIVLLYFYLVALIGLGFVVTGATMTLFGAKEAIFPGLGLSRYDYEFDLAEDQEGHPRGSEAEIERAKKEAKEERRSGGVDGVVSGVIVAGIGAPIMIWHLRHGRRASAGSD